MQSIQILMSAPTSWNKEEKLERMLCTIVTELKMYMLKKIYCITHFPVCFLQNLERFSGATDMALNLKKVL